MTRNFGMTPDPDDIAARMRASHKGTRPDFRRDAPARVVHGQPEELQARNAAARSDSPPSPPSNFRVIGPGGSGGTMAQHPIKRVSPSSRKKF